MQGREKCIIWPHLLLTENKDWCEKFYEITYALRLCQPIHRLREVGSFARNDVFAPFPASVIHDRRRVSSVGLLIYGTTSAFHAKSLSSNPHWHIQVGMGELHERPVRDQCWISPNVVLLQTHYPQPV